jgi:hypothetical protein
MGLLTIKFNALKYFPRAVVPKLFECEDPVLR